MIISYITNNCLRTRLAFCGVWKSTIQHDLQSLKHYCEQLGVEGCYKSIFHSSIIHLSVHLFFCSSFISLSISLDHELFALIVTGRTLETHRKMFNSAALTRHDVLKVKDTFYNRMEDVISILRTLPSSMMLVFR